ncbi:hypothetical protein MMC09_004447 [Bachmanniomyces sp. S44760]|nr:hypothetical protein [Bachmanniomyces sp. S44760]
MAATKDVPSFDDIIKADRERRKHEALAKEIFGKSRRASTPASAGTRKPGSGPSLASRVGITKSSQRSSSTNPKLRGKNEPTINHELLPSHSVKSARVGRLPQENTTGRISRDNRLLEAATLTASRNGAHGPALTETNGKGIIIRGLAGPYVVIGSNFASGTTGADIESAMIPIGGEMQSCRILTNAPTVIAEMVFIEKQGALNVIAKFNNQKADGRILHLYLRDGPPAPAEPIPVFAPASTSSRPIPTAPKANRPDVSHAEPAYDYQRDREQSDRNRRRADPELQDGSYGFGTNHDEMDVEMDDSRETRNNGRGSYLRSRDPGRGGHDRGLYSDDLYRGPRGRGYR